MNLGNLLFSLLVLHLTGLITMAGTTIVEYRLNLPELAPKLSRLSGIGAALLIITGFSMMAVTHDVFGEQLWFRIKFALVILLILNAVIAGIRQRRNSKPRPTWFYLTQLLLFFFIIILSVFKFQS